MRKKFTKGPPFILALENERLDLEQVIENIISIQELLPQRLNPEDHTFISEVQTKVSFLSSLRKSCIAIKNNSTESKLLEPNLS